jgi:hypothetical protein
VEEDYEHLIRINHAHELEGGSQNDLHPDLWCKRKLRDLHILRLGVVLVEISTGAVVKDVRYDKLTREVELALEVADNPSEQLKYRSSFEVAGVVEAASGEDFARVVQYCLRRDVIPETIGEKDLEFFFNRVVAP